MGKRKNCTKPQIRNIHRAFRIVGLALWGATVALTLYGADFKGHKLIFKVVRSGPIAAVARRSCRRLFDPKRVSSTEFDCLSLQENNEMARGDQLRTEA